MKSIEAEIRGELSWRDVPRLKRALKEQGFRHHSSTRRTSVMSFGSTSASGAEWKMNRPEERVDIRCRVTDGKAEVVAKIGETHAANRVEIAQPVSLEQMLGFAKLFASMGFFTKVGSKFTDNFTKDPVTISIVQSRSKITYVEMEIMTDRKNEQKDLQKLRELAHVLGVGIINDPKVFLALCKRLTDEDDWEFRGTAAHIKKLVAEIKRFGSNRNATA